MDFFLKNINLLLLGNGHLKDKQPDIRKIVMKIHSTNYYDTFIEAAADTKTSLGRIPPQKEKKTIAEMQYKLIAEHPYKYTSDELLFQVYADRNALPLSEYESARKAFFSKGQACLRASPLTKNYGFGIHNDHAGKIALYAIETAEYARFLNDPKITKVKAMRSSRKSM